MNETPDQAIPAPTPAPTPTPPAPAPVDEAKALAANAQKNNVLGKAKAALAPAGLGLVCGLLLVGVAAAFMYSSAFAETGNSAFSTIWVGMLAVVAFLSGGLIAIGLPIFWSTGKGHKRALEIITFEVLFLILALVISGFFLFRGQSGNSSIYSTGPSTDSSCLTDICN